MARDTQGIEARIDGWIRTCMRVLELNRAEIEELRTSERARAAWGSVLTQRLRILAAEQRRNSRRLVELIEVQQMPPEVAAVELARILGHMSAHAEVALGQHRSRRQTPTTEEPAPASLSSLVAELDH